MTQFIFQRNTGFKLVVNGITVSISSSAYADEIENHSVSNSFEKADIAIFEKDADDFMTGVFCSEMQGYCPHDDILYFATPIQLIEVLSKVAAYSRI